MSNQRPDHTNALIMLKRLLIMTLSIIAVSYILPGIHIKDLLTAIIVAMVISLLNLIIKPLLILFTLPLTILTMGLFLVVINAFIVIITGKIVPGFTVDGFGWALLFSLLVSLVSGLLGIRDRPSE